MGMFTKEEIDLLSKLFGMGPLDALKALFWSTIPEGLDRGTVSRYMELARSTRENDPTSTQFLRWWVLAKTLAKMDINTALGASLASDLASALIAVAIALAGAAVLVGTLASPLTDPAPPGSSAETEAKRRNEEIIRHETIGRSTKASGLTGDLDLAGDWVIDEASVVKDDQDHSGAPNFDFRVGPVTPLASEFSASRLDETRYSVPQSVLFGAEMTWSLLVAGPHESATADHPPLLCPEARGTRSGVLFTRSTPSLYKTSCAAGHGVQFTDEISVQGSTIAISEVLAIYLTQVTPRCCGSAYEPGRPYLTMDS